MKKLNVCFSWREYFPSPRGKRWKRELEDVASRYVHDRKPWLAVQLSTGNKKSQLMWRCHTVHFLCRVACWTLWPGEQCTSTWDILLSIRLLEFELFCIWLIHFAGVGKPWLFFLIPATVKTFNSYGEKRVCVSNLHRLTAECSSDPRQLWGVLAVQCSADMNAELFWHVLTLAWSLSPC